MKLRVRKAPQQPPLGRRTHPSPAKRNHREVEPSPVRGRGKMQKNETGLFSTIKKFIRGNAVKVSFRLDSQPLIHSFVFSFCNKKFTVLLRRRRSALAAFCDDNFNR